jgi:S-adenosylmethionine:tRNA ribosyltransferase-isomerase
MRRFDSCRAQRAKAKYSGTVPLGTVPLLKIMNLKDFDYNLPEELIAQYPLTPRDSSRLLILNRQTDKIIHTNFFNIIEYLDEGDVLVLNNTKVIPARLYGEKTTGGKVEVLLLEEREHGIWNALLNPSGRVKKGMFLNFQNELSCEILDNPGNGIGRLLKFGERNNFWQKLERIGHIPLPPYIKRPPEENDAKTYQTVFAQKQGAVAAPTAGLHFTPELLKKVQKKGIEIFSVTLHVGYGTFNPVKVDDITQHKMHREFFKIDAETAQSITQAKKDGRRIVACGTTTVRALESAAKESGFLQAYEGCTDIFIYPPYAFKVVDALITNFHFPRSTLLMLVSAFTGREKIVQAYEEAMQQKYRFFSYGDAMLIV